MSDVTQPVKPRASEIEEQAADWLMARRDQRTWTAEDERSFNVWLAASIGNQVAFYRVEAGVSRAERLRALKPSVRRISKIRPIVLKAAAAFSCAAIMLAVAAKFAAEPHMSTYQTAVGERETLSLSDGSQIELNTSSSLRIARDTAGRQAWLDGGEAYFQIKHDARHPFVVIAGESRITDLGTKFTIRRFPDRLEVTLVEGSARLEALASAAGAHSAVLQPGDAATVAGGSITVIRKPPTVLADELGWRRGLLKFRYATLSEAAAEFNRYNRTKIIIEDPAVARLTIYGAFAANNAAAFADAAQIDFKLHVKNRDGQIILAR